MLTLHARTKIPLSSARLPTFFQWPHNVRTSKRLGKVKLNCVHVWEHDCKLEWQKRAKKDSSSPVWRVFLYLVLLSDWINFSSLLSKSQSYSAPSFHWNEFKCIIIISFAFESILIIDFINSHKCIMHILSFFMGWLKKNYLRSIHK